MKGIIVNQNVEYGTYKKCYNGFYQFIMDNGDTIVFEEASSLAIKKYDLKNDRFKNKSFEITYSEYIEGNDEDFVSFKIEKLELA
ncbi:hypothetical protein [uncultured Aquimarina sp.]|uniref:hypothetical protein n=1 Tax=uncultured Aquimarina sp. TaxID=575652 RepID=UPI00262E3957|nr:hypothetical protein [uncultured Aquimarina sp.]